MPVRALIDSLDSVLLGNERVVRLVTATVLARGHVLVQDEPGLGKTLLARAVASALGGSFGRVQGSADLLPADVTGVTVPDRATGEWRFRPGPVMANVVLFDELNRATPRAQAALFEAMAERQITVDGATHPLPDPFFVIGTQNPQDHAGTFPLPEGQLDRFWVSTALAPPSRDVELELVGVAPGYARADALTPVFSADTLRAVQDRTAEVRIAPGVATYVLDIVDALRVRTGRQASPSPRAAQILASVARGFAVIDGRDHLRPDDVKRAAPAVLGHRVASDTDLGAGAAVVQGALDRVPVPVTVTP